MTRRQAPHTAAVVLLRAAAEILAGGWCVDRFYRDGSHDLVGAVLAAAGARPNDTSVHHRVAAQPAVSLALCALADACRPGQVHTSGVEAMERIIVWNDRHATDQAEVLALTAMAITALEHNAAALADARPAVGAAATPAP